MGTGASKPKQKPDLELAQYQEVQRGHEEKQQPQAEKQRRADQSCFRLWNRRASRCLFWTRLATDFFCIWHGCRKSAAQRAREAGRYHELHVVVDSPPEREEELDFTTVDLK